MATDNTPGASSLPDERGRITIAILALGGEGGGVLANWIVTMAEEQGYVAQGTSVPGVAQRTGSTIYYVEMVPRNAPGQNRAEPVLAQMPVPGDVDIVIASELMEAGRAILRGFVSEDRTTLIGSTHRVYAISEKSMLGDGRAASQRILDAAERRAKRFIGFDMAQAAGEAGSVISAIMLGALAGSGALPFPREAFEATIRRGGKAVQSNLAGFALGESHAQGLAASAEEAQAAGGPTTAAGRALHQRIADRLPAPAHAMALEGVRRLMDYQDRALAELYLDRVEAMAALDKAEHAWTLTSETARHLALWMAYEDIIRVADLKVRATRMARVEQEIRPGSADIYSVTEYMHPRLQELCEIMPAALGRRVMASPGLQRRLAPLFRRGRLVETTRLRWFVLLRILAGMRRFRRSTLRWGHEQERIADWLALASEAARTDPAAATEIIRCQGVLKGYSDTWERSCANFATLMQAARSLSGKPDAAQRIAELREAALADEKGNALACAVKAVA
jgi:indolepyruvate ferredoxin oxidoreductase beta subunit